MSTTNNASYNNANTNTTNDNVSISSSQGSLNKRAKKAALLLADQRQREQDSLNKLIGNNNNTASNSSSLSAEKGKGSQQQQQQGNASTAKATPIISSKIPSNTDNTSNKVNDNNNTKNTTQEEDSDEHGGEYIKLNIPSGSLGVHLTEDIAEGNQQQQQQQQQSQQNPQVQAAASQIIQQLPKRKRRTRCYIYKINDNSILSGKVCMNDEIHSLDDLLLKNWSLMDVQKSFSNSKDKSNRILTIYRPTQSTTTTTTTNGNATTTPSAVGGEPSQQKKAIATTTNKDSKNFNKNHQTISKEEATTATTMTINNSTEQLMPKKAGEEEKTKEKSPKQQQQQLVLSPYNNQQQQQQNIEKEEGTKKEKQQKRSITVANTNKNDETAAQNNEKEEGVIIIQEDALPVAVAVPVPVDDDDDDEEEEEASVVQEAAVRVVVDDDDDDDDETQTEEEEEEGTDVVVQQQQDDAATTAIVVASTVVNNNDRVVEDDDEENHNNNDDDKKTKPSSSSSPSLPIPLPRCSPPPLAVEKKKIAKTTTTTTTTTSKSSSKEGKDGDDDDIPLSVLKKKKPNHDDDDIPLSALKTKKKKSNDDDDDDIPLSALEKKKQTTTTAAKSIITTATTTTYEETAQSKRCSSSKSIEEQLKTMKESHTLHGVDPFQIELMIVLNKEDEYSNIIKWEPDGKSFRILNRNAFENSILNNKEFFKTKLQYKSFRNKAKRWNFHVDSVRADYADFRRGKYDIYRHHDELFQRNKLDLLLKMLPTSEATTTTKATTTTAAAKATTITAESSQVVQTSSTTTQQQQQQQYEIITIIAPPGPLGVTILQPSSSKIDTTDGHCIIGSIKSNSSIINQNIQHGDYLHAVDGQSVQHYQIKNIIMLFKNPILSTKSRTLTLYRPCISNSNKKQKQQETEPQEEETISSEEQQKKKVEVTTEVTGITTTSSSVDKSTKNSKLAMVMSKVYNNSKNKDDGSNNERKKKKILSIEYPDDDENTIINPPKQQQQKSSPSSSSSSASHHRPTPRKPFKLQPAAVAAINTTTAKQQKTAAVVTKPTITNTTTSPKEATIDNSLLSSSSKSNTMSTITTTNKQQQQQAAITQEEEKSNDDDDIKKLNTTQCIWPQPSESKYSVTRVRERINNGDGTVRPVTMPKMNKDGTFSRPAGRTRKGMDWDAHRGLWVPRPDCPLFKNNKSKQSEKRFLTVYRNNVMKEEEEEESTATTNDNTTTAAITKPTATTSNNTTAAAPTFTVEIARTLHELELEELRKAERIDSSLDSIMKTLKAADNTKVATNTTTTKEVLSLQTEIIKIDAPPGQLGAILLQGNDATDGRCYVKTVNANSVLYGKIFKDDEIQAIDNECIQGWEMADIQVLFKNKSKQSKRILTIYRNVMKEEEEEESKTTATTTKEEEKHPSKLSSKPTQPQEESQEKHNFTERAPGTATTPTPPPTTTRNKDNIKDSTKSTTGITGTPAPSVAPNTVKEQQQTPTRTSGRQRKVVNYNEDKNDDNFDESDEEESRKSISTNDDGDSDDDTNTPSKKKRKTTMSTTNKDDTVKSPLSKETRNVITISIPPGPLGITLAEASIKTHGYCSVQSVHTNSALQGKIKEGDCLLSCDGTQMHLWLIQQIKSLLQGTARGWRLLKIIRTYDTSSDQQLQSPPVSMIDVSSETLNTTKRKEMDEIVSKALSKIPINKKEIDEIVSKASSKTSTITKVIPVSIPPAGPLGIGIAEPSEETDGYCSVHNVNNDSVLFGKVQKGDWLHSCSGSASFQHWTVNNIKVFLEQRSANPNRTLIICRKVNITPETPQQTLQSSISAETARAKAALAGLDQAENNATEKEDEMKADSRVLSNLEALQRQMTWVENNPRYDQEKKEEIFDKLQKKIDASVHTNLKMTNNWVVDVRVLGPLYSSPTQTQNPHYLELAYKFKLLSYQDASLIENVELFTFYKRLKKPEEVGDMAGTRKVTTIAEYYLDKYVLWLKSNKKHLDDKVSVWNIISNYTEEQLRSIWGLRCSNCSQYNNDATTNVQYLDDEKRFRPALQALKLHLQFKCFKISPYKVSRISGAHGSIDTYFENKISLSEFLYLLIPSLATKYGININNNERLQQNNETSTLKATAPSSQQLPSVGVAVSQAQQQLAVSQAQQQLNKTRQLLQQQSQQPQQQMLQGLGATTSTYHGIQQQMESLFLRNLTNNGIIHNNSNNGSNFGFNDVYNYNNSNWNSFQHNNNNNQQQQKSFEDQQRLQQIKKEQHQVQQQLQKKKEQQRQLEELERRQQQLIESQKRQLKKRKREISKDVQSSSILVLENAVTKSYWYNFYGQLYQQPSLNSHQSSCCPSNGSNNKKSILRQTVVSDLNTVLPSTMRRTSSSKKQQRELASPFIIHLLECLEIIRIPKFNATTRSIIRKHDDRNNDKNDTDDNTRATKRPRTIVDSNNNDESTNKNLNENGPGVDVDDASNSIISLQCKYCCGKASLVSETPAEKENDDKFNFPVLVLNAIIKDACSKGTNNNNQKNIIMNSKVKAAIGWLNVYGYHHSDVCPCMPLHKKRSLQALRPKQTSVQFTRNVQLLHTCFKDWLKWAANDGDNDENCSETNTMMDIFVQEQQRATLQQQQQRTTNTDEDICLLVPVSCSMLANLSKEAIEKESMSTSSTFTPFLPMPSDLEEETTTTSTQDVANANKDDSDHSNTNKMQSSRRNRCIIEDDDEEEITSFLSIPDNEDSKDLASTTTAITTTTKASSSATVVDLTTNEKEQAQEGQNNQSNANKNDGTSTTNKSPTRKRKRKRGSLVVDCQMAPHFDVLHNRYVYSQGLKS